MEIGPLAPTPIQKWPVRYPAQIRSLSTSARVTASRQNQSFSRIHFPTRRELVSVPGWIRLRLLAPSSMSPDCTARVSGRRPRPGVTFAETKATRQRPFPRANPSPARRKQQKSHRVERQRVSTAVWPRGGLWPPGQLGSAKWLGRWALTMPPSTVSVSPTV